MLDDVVGNMLVVLMYSGAFYDLLKGCGEGGRVFNHNAEPLSIKVKCQNRQLGDMVSEEFSLQNTAEGANGQIIFAHQGFSAMKQCIMKY